MAVTLCIGSKIICVEEFKVSSLPSKKDDGIFVYFWEESFSKKGYVSKKYRDLGEMYDELRSGTIIIFPIEVGE